MFEMYRLRTILSVNFLESIVRQSFLPTLTVFVDKRKENFQIFLTKTDNGYAT